MYKRDITVGCKGRDHNAVADSSEHGGMQYFGLTKCGQFNIWLQRVEKAPLILIAVLMVSFTPRLLYPRGKSCTYPLYKGLYDTLQKICSED
jgi:hypothetical protein